MKIIVLDGYTLNPGDLTWDPLRALGDLTVHEHTEPAAVTERSRGSQVLLVNKVVLSADIIDSLSELQYIGVTATGFNIVDIDSTRRRSIPVCNVPTYGTRSVAQMAMAHVLDFTQRVAHHDATVRRDRRWAACRDFCYWDFPLIELDGLTMGIVGLGRIGSMTAQLAEAFGMTVMAFDPFTAEPAEGIRMVDLSSLLRESDVVCLHCPLTPETEKLINTESLCLMKPTAFLVNTSRGQLVDSTALAEALNRGQIAGAGLDVLEGEPPPPNHPLYTAKNCRITPHISWATRAARSRLLQTSVDNLTAWLRSEPQNVVNGV